MAPFASRRHDRLALVCPFYPDANLYELPPVYSGHGRPRVQGAKLATPEPGVAGSRRTRWNVSWYGGGRRDVAVVSGVGHWYKAGQGLVEVRWVFGHDRTGTHRDGYFMTTEVGMSAAEVIETYTARWNLETCQADCTSSRRWVGARRIGYHRPDGVARVGRVAPATPGRSHRRSRMSDTTRRPTPPRA